MSRLELAAYISEQLRKKGIHVVLSGGSCASIYSDDEYVSADLDFVNAGFARRSLIRDAMQSLGFLEERRYFRHPETELVVEYPPGPLAIGEEQIREVKELETENGTLMLLSPTDCVKDRLAWFYHYSDLECLQQAVLVAKHQPIDLDEIERWSAAEGHSDQYSKIRSRLEQTRTD